MGWGIGWSRQPAAQFTASALQLLPTTRRRFSRYCTATTATVTSTEGFGGGVTTTAAAAAAAATPVRGGRGGSARGRVGSGAHVLGGWLRVHWQNSLSETSPGLLGS